MHSVLFEIPQIHLGPLTLGPLPVHAYGTMLALAFIVAMAGAQIIGKRLRTLNADQVINITLIILVSGVLGARGLYVALNYGHQYSQNPIEVFYIWRGGLAFHGGVIGAILAGAISARIMRLSMGAIADTLAPMLGFGYAITKMGCFLNGCCHGRPTEAGWGICFPVTPGNTNDLTPLSHPAQLYDLSMNLVVGCILLWIVFRRRRWNGQAFAWWIILYSITRTITDYFRYYSLDARYSTADPLPGLGSVPFINGVTQAQFASLAMAVAGIVVLIACRKRTFADRVDVVYVPAFALATIPTMSALFGWLGYQSPSDPTRLYIMGAAYIVTCIALAALYPPLARRFFPREDAFPERETSEPDARPLIREPEEPRDAAATEETAEADAPATAAPEVSAPPRGESPAAKSLPPLPPLPPPPATTTASQRRRAKRDAEQDADPENATDNNAETTDSADGLDAEHEAGNGDRDQ